MHKGEVVEEGDHDSLTNARGIYFGLVEQQNLRLAEEEEELAFERNENAVLVRAHQEQENLLTVGVGQQRASSIISLSPSVIQALYGKNKRSDEEIEEDNEKKKKVTEKKFD